MRTLNHLREQIAIAIVDPLMCILSIPLHFRNIIWTEEDNFAPVENNSCCAKKLNRSEI